jgi:hypothetical protein
MQATTFPEVCAQAAGERAIVWKLVRKTTRGQKTKRAQRRVRRRPRRSCADGLWARIVSVVERVPARRGART